MADFEMIDSFETVVSLLGTKDENAHNFLIHYEILSIDHETALKAGIEPDFIPPASITIRELSDYDMGIMSDDPKDNGELGKEVCRLSGWMIMSNLMKRHGYDPHMICDDFSADIEYAWSALNDESVSAAVLFNIVQNVFYVDSIKIAPEYDNAEFKENYLEGLIGNLIQIVNRALDDSTADNLKEYYIDLICYYPTPLPFDNSEHQKETDIASGLVSHIHADEFAKLMNPSAVQDKSEVEFKVAPEIYMQAAGMRISGEVPYPESAKNRAEWDFLEAAGLYECGNTRLLYMTRIDT